MSTRFVRASSQYAERTFATVPGALTLGSYFYLNSAPTTGQSFPIVSIPTSNFSGWTFFINDVLRYQIWDENAGANGTQGATTLSILTWYYLWLQIANFGFGAVDAFHNLSTSAQATRNSGASGTVLLRFARGAGTMAGQYGDISLSGPKVWTASRAASNAASEDDTFALASTTNAYGEYHMLGSDISDHHTTANNLTGFGGTLVAGPNSPLDGGAPATKAPLIHLLKPRIFVRRRLAA